MQDASIGVVTHPKDPRKILWIKRRDLPIWVLPGGGIDPGESADEAVIREVREESGIHVKIVRKGALYTPVNQWTAITHLYICDWESGTPTTGNESKEVGFFPLESPPNPHFPLHSEWACEVLLNPESLIERPLTEFSWIKVGCFFLKHPLILSKYLFSRLSGL